MTRRIHYRGRADAVDHEHAFVEGRCVACGMASSWPGARGRCEAMSVFLNKRRSNARGKLKHARERNAKLGAHRRVPLWRLAVLRRCVECPQQALIYFVARTRARGREKPRAMMSAS